MVAAKTKITLRLDDGSLIGSGEILKGANSIDAVLLTVEDAAQLGRVSEADVARLSSLLETAKSLAADLNVLGTIVCNGGNGIKRPADVHVTAVPPAKRLCPQPSLPFGAVQLSTHTGKLSADMQVCVKLLRKVFAKLGKNKNMFYLPVDPSVAPNYYEYIKKPMCLQQVEEKLKLGTYETALQFADDVRQVWINCKTYNRENDWVWNAGRDAEQHFDKVWKESGLDPSLPGFGLMPMPSIKRENSVAMTSDYQDSQGNFGPENPRRSRRPRVPNRRLSSPSMETSMDDDGVLQAVPSGRLNAAVTTTAEGGKWSTARLEQLSQQISALAEIDEFMSAVQNTILEDPAYVNLPPDQTEINLDPTVLSAPALSRLESLVQQYSQVKSQPPQPASVNPSPHSTQTSMQQQQPLPEPLSNGLSPLTMTTDRKTQLTHALTDLINDSVHLAKVFEIITASGVSTDDGELDMSTLDDAVMWKLDSYVQQVQGNKYNPDGKGQDDDGSSSSGSDSSDSDD